jgi:hypothetical protein
MKYKEYIDKLIKEEISNNIISDEDKKIVLNAYYKYQSLDQNNDPLLKLMKSNPDLIKRFSKFTQSQLTKNSYYGERGQTDTGLLSMYDEFGYDIPSDYRIHPLNKICSFSENNISTEFKKSPEILHAKIPKDLIFYHYKVKYDNSKQPTGEREIVLLDCNFKISGLIGDTDGDTGRKFLNYATGIIVPKSNTNLH